MLKVPEDYLFLVVGDRCWGKGVSEEEAKKKCFGLARKFSKHLVYLVDPSTILDEMGDLVYPESGRSPILLKRVEGKR
jgi:hypothetical protein